MGAISGERKKEEEELRLTEDGERKQDVQMEKR